MTRKEFQGAAGTLTLATDIDASATTIVTTGTATGWPTGATNPFVVEVERGVAGKAEKVLCSARSGNTFTVAGGGRGYDGTTAVAHVATSTAYVEHVVDAVTIDEANAHANDATGAVHTSLLNNARHDLTTRHLLGTSIASGVPGTSTPGDSASEGASTGAARVDHRHAREPYASTITSSTPGQSYAAGTANTLARGDHVHGREAWGAVGDIVALAGDGTAAAGASGKVADAAHKHAMPGFGTPTTTHLRDAASPGTASTLARSDHVHGGQIIIDYSRFVTSAAGDVSVAPNTEDTVATQTVDPSEVAVMMIIWAQVMTREATAALDYAGTLKLKIDSIEVETARIHSHAKGGVVSGSVFAIWVGNGNAHTVDLTFYNDAASGGAVYVSDAELKIYFLGE